jgi:hypothetical protein
MEIDEFSRQLGVLQTQVCATGSNLEAHRQDLRILDAKIESLRADLQELKKLRLLLVGDGDDPGLVYQVAKLAQFAERGQTVWRLLIWIGGLASGLAWFAYAAHTLWQGWHK